MVQIAISPAQHLELVPKALFFDIGYLTTLLLCNTVDTSVMHHCNSCFAAKHTLLLEAMLKSFSLGEHILLIGTQVFYRILPVHAVNIILTVFDY
jgi:hypothetical protein